jgi:Membrane protein involved in the export of O-antigen and teichoic acid
MFGLQTYGIREISRKSEETSGIVGEILKVRVLLSAVLIISVVIILNIFHRDPLFSRLLISYSMILVPTALNLDWFFTGLQKMNYNAIYLVIKNTSLFFMIVFLIKRAEQIYLMPYLYFFSFFLGMLYQVIAYFVMEKKRIAFEPVSGRSFDYLKFGIPFLMSGILAMINNNADGIIIAFTRSKSEAGVYASAYYFIFFLTNVITLIFTPLFPLLVKLHSDGDKTKLSVLCQKTARIVTMLIIPIVLGGMMLSKQLILFIFGEEYSAAYFPFRFLLLYALILFIREIYGYCLNAWNYEKKYLRAVMISSGINLTLNIILTPRYGMNIAAFITVISEIFNLIIMKTFVEKILIINFKTYIFKLIIPNAVMGVVLLITGYFKANFLISVITGMAVYAFMILKLKYVSIDELKGFFKSSENLG